MIEIVFPDDGLERLAFLTAVVTMVLGLGLMAVPRRFGRFLGLQPVAGTNNGVSEIRGPFGGMMMGLGLACIILAQPFTYFALGLAFVGAVLGRLVSMVFDRTLNAHCLIATFIELLGAYFTLNFALQAFGLI